MGLHAHGIAEVCQTALWGGHSQSAPTRNHQAAPRQPLCHTPSRACQQPPNRQASATRRTWQELQQGNSGNWYAQGGWMDVLACCACCTVRAAAAAFSGSHKVVPCRHAMAATSSRTAQVQSQLQPCAPHQSTNMPACHIAKPGVQPNERI